MATMFAPTYTYDAEREQLARQQRLIDAMQANALEPATVPQGGMIASKMNPLQPMAKVLQAYMASKGQEGMKQSQDELARRYNADLRTGMDKFIDGISTQPGMQPAVQGNNPSAFVPEQQLGPEDAMAARKKAVLDAIASGHPVMQQLGMSELGNLRKQGVDIKDLLTHATPESQEVMVRTGSPTGFKAKKEKPIIVDNMLVDPTSLKIIEISGEPPAQVTINGDLYQVNPSTRMLKKLDNAPKITNTVHGGTIVNKGESEFAKGIGKLNAEELGNLRKQGDAARKLQPILSKLEELTDKGTFSGPTANAAMWLGELASTMGIPVEKDKIARSEEYASVLAKQISSYLTAGSGVGRSLTDADRAALERQFPEMTKSPEGRKQIIRMLRDASQREIAQADAAEEHITKMFQELTRLAPGGVASSPAPVTPNTPSVGQPGKPRVKNW